MTPRQYGYPQLPDTFAAWFDVARVVILFVLGVGLIIYAAITTGHDIPFIVAGLVLCGLVPIDLWLTAHRNGKPAPSEKQDRPGT